MSEQINPVDIPFTNEHFIAFCEKMLGQPYWMGTCVYKATDGLLTRKAKQYPSSYSSSRMNRYRHDIAAGKVVADCVGGCKGYCWTGGGQGVLEAIGTGKTFSSKYGANGCPDKGATSMFAYAKQKGMAWGTLDTLPEIVGLALYKPGHMGYYTGGGYAIEWKGFAYGCMKTKVDGRGWTHWYMLPFIEYGDTTNQESHETPKSSTDFEHNYGTRLILYRKGKTMMRGDDVLAIQARLTELGFDPGKADGVYGPKSSAAVIAFQTARKKEADSIVGPITRAELKKE